MPSFVTVNNNVALLSITIAPSTWVASLTLALVFLYLYLPPIPPIRLNSLFFKRSRQRPGTLPAAEDAQDEYHDPYHYQRKTLPDLPTRGLLTNYSYFDHERERERANSKSRPKDRNNSGSTRRKPLLLPAPEEHNDGRPPRRQSSRLPTALPAPDPRAGDQVRLPVGPLWLPQRGERGRGRRGPTLGRLGRWLQSAGLEASRKRRPE